MILYSYFRSSAAYRVRIALNLKKISYEYRSIHLVNNGGEQYSNDYKKLNPMAEIPTIIDDKNVISQSVAIIEYLDAKYPNPKLIPTDLYQAAKVRQFYENINSGIHPIQNLKVLNKLDADYQTGEEGKKKWARHWIEKGFQSLEQMLKNTAGIFAFGDQVTAADLFLVPQVFNARRYELDLKPFPLIVKVDESCNKLDAFKKAHPMQQPDTPASN